MESPTSKPTSLGEAAQIVAEAKLDDVVRERTRLEGELEVLDKTRRGFVASIRALQALEASLTKSNNMPKKRNGLVTKQEEPDLYDRAKAQGNGEQDGEEPETTIPPSERAKAFHEYLLEKGPTRGADLARHFKLNQSTAYLTLVKHKGHYFSQNDTTARWEAITLTLD